jgi:hypothetical protein
MEYIGLWNSRELIITVMVHRDSNAPHQDIGLIPLPKKLRIGDSNFTQVDAVLGLLRNTVAAMNSATSLPNGEPK